MIITVLYKILKRHADSESFLTKTMPEPCIAVWRGGQNQIPTRTQAGDLGIVTGRAQPGLRQQHDVDVVLNEGGNVRPSPGCADEPFIAKANKSCVSG